MKKTLLLLLITGVWGTSQAQTSSATKPAHASAAPEKLALLKYKARQAAEKKGVAASSSDSHSRRPHRITSEPLLPFLGSSANVNSVRDASTTATTANQACNLLVMTHRENQSQVGTCGTGAYVAAFSTNGGTVWDTTISIFCNQPSRYPNGVLFNPAGNTNPAMVTDVMAGPWTNSATTGDSWVETVYGSVMLEGTGSNIHQSYWINGTPGVITQNTGDLSFMSSSDDSTVHIIGEGYNVNTAGDFTAWLGAVLTTGKYSATLDSMIWTQQVFRPHLVPDIIGYASMSLPFDSDAAPIGEPGTAWSQDGKTGYVVIFGNLDSAGYNYVSAQPIVYKSTDAGANWVMMPPYNFANIPSLTTYLYPSSDSAIKTPLWYLIQFGSYYQGANDDYDLTVDAYGNLHILGAVISGFYSNPDSAYQLNAFINQHGYIYDVFTTSSGGWDARYIDSMNTYPCKVVTEGPDWTSTSGSAPSSVAFGNRLQASRTTDGKYVFCTWLDDVTGNVPDSLVYPDVFGQGFNVTNGKETLPLQFTYTENNYFLCVSDIVMPSGTPDTTFTVPCTIVFPEVAPGGVDDGDEPINYFYLDTVQYNDTLFKNSTGLSVHNVYALGFSVSQNYPNPFNNTTKFNINLAKESLVSVDVFNMFGQKVYSIGSQNMETGNHLVTINSSGWNSGVYFYRVTVNNQTVTKKMVVQ